jgi:hypothetical protein
MYQIYVGQGADWIKVAHKYVNNYEFSKEGNVFRTGVTSIVL